MSFFEQYKSPEWQKKRLEALHAAEFSCQRCYDSESQLHVHHKRYVKGRKIWEYGVGELEVLCEMCHDYAHEEKDRISALLASFPTDAMNELYWLIIGFASEIIGPTGFTDYEDSPVHAHDQRIFDAGVRAAQAVNSSISSGNNNG